MKGKVVTESDSLDGESSCLSWDLNVKDEGPWEASEKFIWSGRRNALGLTQSGQEFLGKVSEGLLASGPSSVQ